MSVQVKICGITRLEDALDAVDLGADALGFNFWPESKRFCPPARATKIIARLPPFVTTVGVFVNSSRAHVRTVARRTGVAMVQLHGDESPQLCRALRLPFIKAVRMENAEALDQLSRYRPAAFLLDAPSSGFGGSGRIFDWALFKRARSLVPLILAGGLTPLNVREAVRRVQPAAVDVASGVESSPGRKDFRKMKRFVQEAKES